MEGFNKIKEVIKDIISIINNGIFPKKKGNINKCIECTYNNICIK
jgi:CRISPR/Cas system-associated exonuclease Cas4 (RecB family)